MEQQWTLWCGGSSHRSNDSGLNPIHQSLVPSFEVKRHKLCIKKNTHTHTRSQLTVLDTQKSQPCGEMQDITKQKNKI